ncbi:MAG: MBL fold metallo-hydrolase [Eubacteriales bacterium]|nr:MBL fold metallo-hydrolase [Eubacteriales bacterium]
MNTLFKKMTAVLMIAFMLLFSGCLITKTDESFADGDCAITFLDVGNADSSLIRCGDEYMLIDGGNNDDGDWISTFLMERGISTLKYVVATHPHEDHIGGLDDVIYNIDVQMLLIPQCEHEGQDAQSMMQTVNAKEVYTEYAQVGDKYTLGDGSFEIIGPVNITGNMNGNSIVLRYDYQGVSALFTGDAERKEEQAMLDRGLISDIDILKVGHHGS